MKARSRRVEVAREKRSLGGVLYTPTAPTPASKAIAPRDADAWTALAAAVAAVDDAPAERTNVPPPSPRRRRLKSDFC